MFQMSTFQLDSWNRGISQAPCQEPPKGSTPASYYVDVKIHQARLRFLQL
jgi:hypothetical protein